MRKTAYSRAAFAFLLAGTLLLLTAPLASAQIVWPVYASSGDGGSIAPAGTVYVPDGAAVSFSFIPAPGCMVSQVIVDGTAVAGNIPSYTLVGIHAAQTIQVAFVAAPGVIIVAPAPDVVLFGGVFDRGRDVRDYSRRGSESRAAAHPEIRGRAPAHGDERDHRR